MPSNDPPNQPADRYSERQVRYGAGHERQYEIGAEHSGADRRERILDFYATLMVLTPRVFVTHLILGVNVLLFVLMVIGEPKAISSPSVESLIFWGANYGPLTLNGQPWRLFTSMFLHIGILHIAINMWVLWDIGRLMERVVGNVGFVLLYLVSGLCGSLASVAWNSQVLSAGASGAVFGLFGGLLGFLVLGKGSMPTEVATSLRSSAIAFIGFSLVIGLFVGRIDNAAHIGGLLGGCLCGLILGQPLTLHAGDYRWLRNLLVLVVGGGIVAGALVLLPRPADIQGTLREFNLAKAKVKSTYNDLVKKAQSKELSPSQFSDALEAEVLPPWREARQRLEGLADVPPHLRPLISTYANHSRLQQESWELQVQVNRDQNRENLRKFKEHQKSLEAAEQQLEQISGEMGR